MPFSESIGAKSILDIGTGTGICGLYLASIHPNITFCVGIDAYGPAAQLTKENYTKNTLACRRTALHIDLASYASSYTEKFDLIVCNPPFFSDPSKSPKVHRQFARHTDALAPEVLFLSCRTLLSEHGVLWIVIPNDQRALYQQTACLAGLYFNRELIVKTDANKPDERRLICFSHDPRGYARREMLLPELIHNHGY